MLKHEPTIADVPRTDGTHAPHLARGGGVGGVGVGAEREGGVCGTSPWIAACGLLTSGASMPRDSSSPSGETTSTSTGHFATLRNHRFFGPSGQMGSLSRTAAPGHMLLPNPLQAEGGHEAPSEIERRKIAMAAAGGCLLRK